MTGEKRGEKRFKRKVKVQLVEGGRTMPAVTADISPHGIRLRAPRGLGGETAVQVVVESGREKLVFPGEIRWQCGADGLPEPQVSEVGVHILDAPPQFLDAFWVFGGRPVADHLDSLHAMPSLILDLMALLNDPQSTVAEIENRIRLDQVLVVYLLQVVNSPLYGLPRGVTSLRKALTLLGFSTLKGLLLGYLSRQLGRLVSDRRIQKQLWTHSLQVALLTRECGRGGGERDDELYVAGLLHDIARPVLALLDIERFRRVEEEVAQAGVASYEAEQRYYSFSHIDLGDYLVTRWSLAEPLAECIAFHHHPELCPADNPFIHAVALADRLAHSAFDGRGSVPPESFARAGRRPEDAPTLLAVVEQQLATLL